MSNHTIKLYEKLTTRRRISDAVVRINGMYEVDIVLDKHAAGYRIFTPKGREISPRLPAKEMLLWLEGFEAGLDTRG